MANISWAHLGNYLAMTTERNGTSGYSQDSNNKRLFPRLVLPFRIHLFKYFDLNRKLIKFYGLIIFRITCHLLVLTHHRKHMHTTLVPDSLSLVYFWYIIDLLNTLYFQSQFKTIRCIKWLSTEFLHRRRWKQYTLRRISGLESMHGSRKRWLPYTYARRSGTWLR